MKQRLVLILFSFLALACIPGESSPVHFKPKETDYIIFGSYQNIVTKINTAQIYKLTGTHLLRSPNGFFNSFLNIPCDTLSNYFFLKAQHIKEVIPGVLLQVRDTVFGRKEGVFLPSVYVEIKLGGRTHSVHIYPGQEKGTMPAEIWDFYSEVKKVLDLISF